MSRIHVSIDQIVLKGFEPGDRKSLVEALEAELFTILADPVKRTEWARPHRTPVLRLPQMQHEPGPAGGRKLGKGIARAIGKGLKP